MARQGLALRRVDDSESNLIQLLQLRAEDDPRILQWLRKSQQKYTSHENQNEISCIMANVVPRTILEKISQSPFITIMVDETTDITNKERKTYLRSTMTQSRVNHLMMLNYPQQKILTKILVR